MVTLPILPLVSRLVQRILQVTQGTKEPHRKVRERRKEREKERNRLQVKKLFSKQQKVTNGYWILPNYNHMTHLVVQTSTFCTMLF